MIEKDIFSLKGKVIVVTGATGVLGHSFIKALSAAGAAVGVMGRNEKVANEPTCTNAYRGSKCHVFVTP